MPYSIGYRPIDLIPERYLILSKNDLELRYIFSEGGTFTEVILPETRLAEAYVLCMNTIPSFEEFMRNMRVKRNEDRSIREYKSAIEFSEIKIKEKGDSVVVTLFSGC